MKTTQKLLSVLLAIFLFSGISAFGLTASATDSVSPDGYLYYSGNTITGVIDKTTLPADYTIPSEISGNTITAIGYSAFSKCTSLTTVTIPSTVTSIGDFAFSGCSALGAVTFSDRTDKDKLTIGQFAFEDCDILKSVNLEDSNVISIDSGAFRNSGLTEITIPDTCTSVGGGIFTNCKNLKSAAIGCNVTSLKCNSVLGSGMFEGCTNLQDVNLIENTKLNTIDENAFNGCTSLEAITIPETVTTIGDSAFSKCTSLENITIPASVTSIGNFAFSSCNILGSVTFSDRADNQELTIGQFAFEYCKILKTVNLEDSNVKSIDSGAFRSTGLTKITIPDTCTSVGGGIFTNCKSLKSATIGCNVTSLKCNSVLGCGMFQDCTYLQEVNLAENTKLDTIDENAFSGCTSLKTITIPDTVTILGQAAFNKCSSLTDIFFETRTTDQNLSIEYLAFDNCTALSKVHAHGMQNFWDSLLTIGTFNTSFTNATVCWDCTGNSDTPAHDHSYTKSVTKQATCIAEGITTYTCSCGDTYTETIPATGHKDYNSDGVCDVCGAVKADNPFKDAVLNVVKNASVSYNSKVTITATATGMPDDCMLVMYVGDKEIKGTSTEVSYTINNVKSDIEYSVYVVDKDGAVRNIIRDSMKNSDGSYFSETGHITCNSNIFARIIAFFKSLFGITSEATIKP